VAPGCGSPANTRRSRGTSTFAQLSASYIAPCPRRCSAVSERNTGCTEMTCNELVRDSGWSVFGLVVACLQMLMVSDTRLAMAR
jgi:hypothetical protein